MTPDAIFPPGVMTPEQVVKIVDQMERDRGLLHTRMDQDYSRWRGDPYTGEDALDGFAKFTANDARTYFNWHLGVITTAKRIVRVEEPEAQRQQRQTDNMKEFFVQGLWNAIDERRVMLLQPRLVPGMGWQVNARGRRVQRALLIKKLDEHAMEHLAQGQVSPAPDDMSAQALEGGGTTPQIGHPSAEGQFPQQPPTMTYVDVMDWDPRNTYWEVGNDGLEWACHKLKKTRGEIIGEFGVDPVGETPVDVLQPKDEMTGEHHPEWWTYEWFDARVGMVILESGTLLKPPTPHGMARTPVCIGMVGSLPVNIQADGEVHEEDYGESIFHPLRDIYDENNFMLSIMKELAHRSIHQPLVWPSRDGTKLPDEDPRLTGSDIPVGIGEEPKPLPPMEMVKETGAYLGLISAMEQRGSVSHLAYGSTDFTLSGYAMNTLRQGENTAVKDQLECVISGLKQIFDLLCDSYVTGLFDTMTLAGRTGDSQRRYFNQAISPELVAQGGLLEIDLVPMLAQDDAAKVTVAKMLDEDNGSGPLADKRFIRQEILDFQNVDLMERAVLEQQARVAGPLALAWSMMIAAEQQGDMELAELWSIEVEDQLLQRMLQRHQLQMMGAEMGVGQSTNGTGGPSAEGRGRGRRPAAGVLPGPAQGLPPTTPTPQQGAIAAPGTPRPSRQGQRPNYGPEAMPPWAR